METTTFTVTGRGSFPLDMLRWDQCYPQGPDDVANIDVGQRREIKLVHVGDRRHWEPTKDRWASFNWVVCRVNDIDIDGPASWNRAVYGEAADNFLDEFFFEVWLGTGTGIAERSVVRIKASDADDADRELRRIYGDTLDDWKLID